MESNRKLPGMAALLAATMLLILAAGPTLRSPGAARADAGLPQGVDGVLSLTPVLASSYIAVELATGPTTSVTGLKWVHNDATSAFPRVLVVGAGEDGLPDLTDVRAQAATVQGGNLTWGELALSSPLAPSAGTLFAVFQLPAFEEHTSDGLGGGGGLGYRNVAGGRAAYLSHDGVDWVRMSSRISVAVESIVSAAAGTTGTQSKGAGTVPEAPAEAATPAVTALQPVEPGSAAGASTVRFSLARAGQAVIEVYNVRGQRVRTLAREALGPGEHVVHWEGSDDRGSPVASGTYIVRMEALGQTFHRKLTIVR